MSMPEKPSAPKREVLVNYFISLSEGESLAKVPDSIPLSDITVVCVEDGIVTLAYSKTAINANYSHQMSTYNKKLEEYERRMEIYTKNLKERKRQGNGKIVRYTRITNGKVVTPR